MTRVLLTTGLVALAGLAVAAGPQQATFRSATTLVVQPVTVMDAEGRPIEGLRANDFVVTEDGVTQTLSFVEFQRLRDGIVTNPLGAVPTIRTSEVTPAVDAGIGASSAANARYRDRRLLAFYFDLPGMPPPDRTRALLSADRFIASQMTEADVVAVMTFAGDAVRVKQDFTDDRGRLHEVLRKLIEGEDRDGDGVPDAEPERATDFGQNDDEFNFLRTDRQLAALQTAVAKLKPLAEQKTLLYFVSGLRLRGLDNQAQLVATINAAIRANVSINPIDARGLVAEAPLGGANVASPTGIGIFTGAPAQARRDQFARSQDTLHGLALDTGGRAFFDYNDLALGIRQAAAAMKSYYLLGYYTTRPEKDGRFRRVRVSVIGRPSAKLTYREGYFGEKEFVKFTGADKERQLEDALMLGDPITEIPIAMEVNYFQLNRAEYFIPVSVKIPGAELAVERNGRIERAEIDLIGEVKDERGVTVQNVRDKLEIPLTARDAAALATRPVRFESGFTLLPGQYVIKVLVRNSTSGRIGTYQTSFVVPNLNRETTFVRTSSIVLAGERLAPGDALYSVRQKVSADTANPLVRNGTKLLPSVTRVFSREHDLRILFDTYRMDGVANGPLVAFVSLYKDGVRVFESDPFRREVNAAVVRFEIAVPLSTVAPGEYDCQVSILDLGQKKVRFSRTPIVLVP